MLTLSESALRIKALGPEVEISLMAEAFKFRPPDYWRAHSYQLFKSTGRGWDGYLRPFKTYGKTTGLILRGRKTELLEKCGEYGISVDTDKLLTSPFHRMTVDDLPDDLIHAPFELDENQRVAVVSWLKAGIGMIHASVSSGKTAIYSAAVSMIHRRLPSTKFLYMVQSERLCSQVHKECSKFLPSFKVSKFGGGSHERMGDLVVATTAMLYKHFDYLLRDGWFSRFGCLCLDEVHHVPSKSNQKIVLAVPAFFRLGASDSAKKEDIVAHNAILGLSGPILHEITAAPLIKIGRIAKPLVYIVEVPEWRERFSEVKHAASPNSPAWVLLNQKWQKGTYLGPVLERDEDGEPVRDRREGLIQIQGLHSIQIGEDVYEIESRWCLLDRLYDRAIIRFKERNQLIVDWVRYYTGKEYPTLVVATRTLHVYILQNLISKEIGEDKVRVLFSIHSPKERDEAFEWFTSGKGRVLISPLVKEGVSLPLIKAGVIADRVASWEVANQLVGRFIRKKVKGPNEAFITWFLDNQCPQYYRASLNLFQKLRQIEGYEFKHPVVGPPAE